MNAALSEFFAGWGAADATGNIKAAFGNSIYYCDPQCAAPITDADGLAQMVAIFGQHMPGGSAQVVKLDEHHGHARATVAFMMGDKPMMHGHYFADLDADGKILRLVGFPGLGQPD